MKHGNYKGDDPESRSRMVLVQFDNLDLPIEFTHGWASFYSYEFKIDKG